MTTYNVHHFKIILPPKQRDLLIAHSESLGSIIGFWSLQYCCCHMFPTLYIDVADTHRKATKVCYTVRLLNLQYLHPWNSISGHLIPSVLYAYSEYSQACKTRSEVVSYSDFPNRVSSYDGYFGGSSSVSSSEKYTNSLLAKHRPREGGHIAIAIPLSCLFDNSQT